MIEIGNRQFRDGTKYEFSELTKSEQDAVRQIQDGLASTLELVPGAVNNPLFLTCKSAVTAQDIIYRIRDIASRCSQIKQ